MGSENSSRKIWFHQTGDGSDPSFPNKNGVPPRKSRKERRLIQVRTVGGTYFFSTSTLTVVSTSERRRT